MLALFGTPLGADARRVRRGVAAGSDGHEERLALYQLFPLLVHAVLFGGGYVGVGRGRGAALRVSGLRRRSPR